MKSNSCAMFAEYHVIQFILHCLITKTEDHSAQTTACTVGFGTESNKVQTVHNPVLN
jgi:hypothetical protein